MAGPAAASAPPLRGAATHPLWADSSVADFDRELDLLAAAGANTVRIDLGWSTLEQDAKGQRAQWYVDKADIFFAHARERGLRPIVTFFTTPCWASSAPPDLKQGCAGAWWERGVSLYPPSDPADLADAAAWVASRWGDDIAAIEIWNEPNYYHWFRSSEPAADYAALLRAAYGQIKQVEPDLPVIGPAMLASDGAFLNALYGEGIGGHFDGLSLRPFNQGRDPYDSAVPPTGLSHSFLLGVPSIRDIMVAHGDGAKQMWFTELGWSSCAPGGTSSWCITPELQARYVADAFRIIRDRWSFVASVSVYNLRNKGDDPSDRESQMGLLHRDFTPKPAYASFSNVLAEMAAQPFPPDPPSPVTTDPVATPQPSHPGPGGRVPPPKPRDRKPPALTRFAASPGKGGRMLAITYRLSEPAGVMLRLERATDRPGWAGLGRPALRRGRRGVNHVRLPLSGARPGRYRLSAYANDAAGNRSHARRARFSVEARRVTGRSR